MRDPEGLPSEESYRAIFDSANDAIFVHDIETGRILDVNRRMCELYGYTVEEACRLTVGDISSGEPPFSQQDAVEHIRKAGVEGAQVFDWLCKRRNGELFPVEVNLKRATIGGQDRMLAIVRDITERKRVENELQEERDRTARYLDVAGVMILALDEHGTITLLNQKGCEILGCDSATALGRNWFDNYLPERVRQQTREVFAQIIAGRIDGSDRHENPIVTSTGEERIILWHNVTLTQGQGRRIGTLSSGEDVTERRRAEKALRESEERYRGLVDHSPIPILVHTGDEIVFLNPEAIRVIGGTNLEQFTGRSIWEFLHKDERAIAEERVRAAQERGERGELIEHKLVRLDGTVIQAEVTGTPIVFEGKPSIQVVFRDVSERRLLEEQLRHSQKMEGIGRLAGGIAHDFNNILQAILGYVDIALERTNPADERHDVLGRVRDGAKRAADLTGQLLVFSRRQLLEPTTLDVNQLLGGMMQMLRRLIRENIELEFLPGTGANTIHADPGQIEQTVLNLCLNARDAIVGGGRVLIATRKADLSYEFCREHPGARAGSFVVLSVSDSGSGMNAETRRRMFEPFFTTKEVGKGTGLGLATVYGIVKQHDGFIQVRSEPGAGTTFEVYLPAVTAPSPEVESEPDGEAHRSSETVLVAEDDEMVRELNRRILEEAGYRVLTAADGREAVDIFRSHAGEISLALLDVVMPKLGGLEVHNRIRAINPDVPVLFCSGYSPEAIHAQFIRDESVQVIRKPHSRHTLLDRVREALAEQRTKAASIE
jgi:two-component system cell cycle sensor histidine kinase/response regulator CckA